MYYLDSYMLRTDSPPQHRAADRRAAAGHHCSRWGGGHITTLYASLVSNFPFIMGFHDRFFKVSLHKFGNVGCCQRQLPVGRFDRVA